MHISPPPPQAKPDADLIIVGGGLAGCLIALALAARQPEQRILLVEQEERLGGDHVWSFFATDIAAGDAAWVEPLIVARWQGYDVHFPGHSRRLSTPYRSVTSERLDAVVRQTLPADAIRTGANVCALTPDTITLTDGRTFSAHAVIDARGSTGMAGMAGGWQKFMGQTLRLAAPHGLDRPVVMDARVEQVDGFRFVYCLPFSPTRVFVEDTYYADGPTLDHAAMRARISAYAQAANWQVDAVEYEETGVLPVIAAGDFEAFWRADGDTGTARAGTRAALVHPLTSYTFPTAVKFASYISTLDKPDGTALGIVSHAWAAEHWRGGRYYRMLTRLLFAAAQPQARYRVLERFYTLAEGLIERFYAGASRPADRLRILAGRPPVPLGAAVASLMGRGRPLTPLDAPRNGEELIDRQGVIAHQAPHAISGETA